MSHTGQGDVVTSIRVRDLGNGEYQVRLLVDIVNDGISRHVADVVGSVVDGESLGQSLALAKHAAYKSLEAEPTARPGIDGRVDEIVGAIGMTELPGHLT